MTTSQLDRFLAKIEQRDGCWLWTAGRIPNGYGKFKLDGRTRLAHRVSYEYFVATIASGLEIDHLCRNRACVNPIHLEAVTHSVNVLRGLVPSVMRVIKRGNTNLMGFKHSAETKAKQSVARRAYWKRKREAA
jgi:hypothetical protein